MKKQKRFVILWICLLLVCIVLNRKQEDFTQNETLTLEVKPLEEEEISIEIQELQETEFWNQEKERSRNQEDENEAKETQAESYLIVEKEYIENEKEEGREEHNFIEIAYPQLYGLSDREKENRINMLIENDVKKAIEDHGAYEMNNLRLHLEQKSIFCNTKMISIAYLGYSGATYFFGAGYARTIMATAIDLEEERILMLDDVITDFEALYDRLLADQFEDITMWEGTTELFSQQHYGGRKALEEDLKNYLEEGNYHCIQWYTDGEHFVFVEIWGRYYHEYAIKIDKIKDILSEEFLSLLE